MKLGELARALGATLEGGPEDLEITGVAAHRGRHAGDADLPRRSTSRAPGSTTTRAAAVLLAARCAGGAAPGAARGASLPGVRRGDGAVPPGATRPQPGVHPTAVVAATADARCRARRSGRTSSIGDGRADRTRRRPARRASPSTRDARIGDGFTAHAGAVVREAVRDRRPRHAARRRGRRQRRLRLRAAARRAPQDPAGRHRRARGRRRDRRQQPRSTGRRSARPSSAAAPRSTTW